MIVQIKRKRTRRKKEKKKNNKKKMEQKLHYKDSEMFGYAPMSSNF